MAADDMPVDAATIREACHAALSVAGTELLVEQLEGHVRLLAPEVAARAPKASDDMAALARIVLRHADEALNPAAPSVDRQTRLHDLGTAARALLTLSELTAPEEDDAPEADDDESADPTGWLLIIGPGED